MKLKEKARCIEVPYTNIQRIKIYFRKIWRSILTSPPKTYDKWEYLNPGDEGYEDCKFEVHYYESKQLIEIN